MFNTACWNIRGLNDPLKQREVKSFIRLNKINIFGFVETRVRQPNFAKISKAVAPSWCFVQKYHASTLGRIWVGWDPNIHTVQVISSSDQAIHCQISLVQDNIQFKCSIIYATNLLNDRLVLWNQLKNLASSFCNSPWILLGDFNNVRLTVRDLEVVLVHLKLFQSFINAFWMLIWSICLLLVLCLPYLV